MKVGDHVQVINHPEVKGKITKTELTPASDEFPARTIVYMYLDEPLSGTNSCRDFYCPSDSLRIAIDSP